jgi:hypothetical protein
MKKLIDNYERKIIRQGLAEQGSITFLSLDTRADFKQAFN